MMKIKSKLMVCGEMGMKNFLKSVHNFPENILQTQLCMKIMLVHELNNKNYLCI